MRLAFAGTPAFAATVLRGLMDSRHEVGLVISQPDARRGRGRKAIPTPVAKTASEAGLNLLQPESIGEVVAEIARCDALVVAAYGQILRSETLEAVEKGAWNVHASLLPVYRGAAPVERSIMAGEATSGVTIMRMSEGLDTGPFVLRRETAVDPDETGGELTSRLAELGARAMVETLDPIELGEAELEEQDESRASYAEKIRPGERFVNWSLDAGQVHDHIRALSPHIGARSEHPDVEGPVKLIRSRVSGVSEESQLEPGEIKSDKHRILVGCGSGAVEITELQMPSARAMPTAEFLVGNRLEGRFSS